MVETNQLGEPVVVAKLLPEAIDKWQNLFKLQAIDQEWFKDVDWYDSAYEKWQKWNNETISIIKEIVKLNGNGWKENSNQGRKGTYRNGTFDIFYLIFEKGNDCLIRKPATTK